MDADQRALWEICVRRDIEAFVAQDWSICEGDFESDGFVGLDARFTADPAGWRLTFPTLSSYRDAWKQQNRDFFTQGPDEDHRAAIYAALRLDPIVIEQENALIYKKFDGEIAMRSRAALPLHWQSLFFARKVNGLWKLRGFVGYLPFPWPGKNQC